MKNRFYIYLFMFFAGSLLTHTVGQNIMNDDPTEENYATNQLVGAGFTGEAWVYEGEATAFKIEDFGWNHNSTNVPMARFWKEDGDYTANFYQTMTVPNGRYRFTMRYSLGGGTPFIMYAAGYGGEEVEFNLPEGTIWGGPNQGMPYIEVVVTTGTLTVGVRTTDSNNSVYLNAYDWLVYPYRAWEDNPLALRNAYDYITENAIKGGNSALNEVWQNLQLPTSYEGVEISWTSSKPAFLGIDGVVNLPEEFNETVILTATFTYSDGDETYFLVKKFTVSLVAESPVGLIAKWNFENESLGYDNDVQTAKAYNQENEINDDFVGSFLNNARVRTIGEATQFNVLDLGDSNGYFDLGTNIGKIVYSLNDYTMSAYIRADAEAVTSGNGHFLWSFSNSANINTDANGYVFVSPIAPRYASTKTNWSGETGNSLSASGFYQNNSLEYKDNWHHIMYAQIGGTGTLYVDGMLAATDEVALTPAGLAKEGFEGTPFNWIGRSCYSGDKYLHKTLVYDFQILGIGLSEDDIAGGLFVGDISATIDELNEAYAENPDYKPETLENSLEAITIETNNVTENFSLPKSDVATTATIWNSSLENIISVEEINGNWTAVVKRPALYNQQVILTVTLMDGPYLVSKSFNVVVAGLGKTFEDALLVNYDFQQVEGRKVIDAAEMHFEGTLMNEAKIVTLETDDNEQINVLDLGNGTGYFDMGYEIGQIMYNTDDYTLSAYFRIDENYSGLGSLGNFLWTFSNSEGGGGEYVIALLRDQRIEVSGYDGEEHVGQSFGIKENDAYVQATKGEWQHFAYTQEGDLGIIYLNGVEVSSAVFPLIPSVVLPIEGRSGTLYNWIGRSNFASDAYLRQTQVYDFRMYNVPLTEADFLDDLDVQGTIDKLNGSTPIAGVSQLSKSNSPYQVYVRNNQIVINGLTGDETVAVFDVMGRCQTISDNGYVSLSAGGVYIVKVNQWTTKVLVR